MTPDTPAPGTRKATILKPVLVYLVIASLWILLSDRAVEWLFRDPSAIVFASSIKGWLFVAVTGGLLFLLLARRENLWREAVTAPGQAGPAPKTMPLPLIFVALVLVVPLIGVSFYQTQAPQIEAEALKNLQAIARLKAEQIEHWLMERDGDTQVLKTSSLLGQQIEALSLGQADATTRRAVLARLQTWQRSYGYASILVLAPSGKVLLGQGAHQQMPPNSRTLATLAITSRQMQRGQLYRADNGDIHLEWAVPVLVSTPQGEQMVAALLLRTRAADYLYPLIQSWPVTSESGESLLVRRDGDTAVYLNDLRHRPGSYFGKPLASKNLTLPAARAVLATEPGTMQGVDYREVSVLAAYRPVAGTDWHIVAKVDRAEVLAPLWRSLYWVTLTATVAVAAIMLALGLLWQQQRRGQQLELLAVRTKADRLLAALIDNSTDAIFIKDLQGRYTMANPEVARVMGKSLPELLGQDDVALLPEHAPAIQANDFRVMTENKVSTLEEEVNSVDGVRTYLATKGPLHDASGQVIGMFGIARDITERKRAEQLVEQQSLFAQAILDSVSSEIAVLDNQGVILAVNRPWQRFGLENGLEPGQLAPHTGVGTNYLDVCGAPPRPSADLALSAGDGIRAVIDGKLPSFTLEYTCHSPEEQRWFSMSVTPLGQGGRGVVVVHTNITERMQAAAREEQRNEELARFNRAAVGREIDMIDLKKRVNELAAQLGQPAPYPLAFVQKSP